MSDACVPRRVERLLESLGADTDFREAVLGDLAEEFALRVEGEGPAAARRWYYRECLRVAPSLMRDWWRNLGWSQVGYFASVVLISLACLMLLETSLQRAVRAVLLTQSTSLDGLPSSNGLAALMLLWTLIDGAFAGYVAARLGRRAPVPSTLLLAITMMSWMIWTGWGGVPPWFLAANVTTMTAGTIAGYCARCAAYAHSDNSRLFRLFHAVMPIQRSTKR